MTYEELERYVDRLPELYAKHSLTPDTGCHEGECGTAKCALEVLAIERGIDYWGDVIEGGRASTAFCQGFDGCDSTYGGYEEYHALGRRAASLVGLNGNNQ